ncbi:MAG: glycosyltransferase family 4 protein [Candidatus Promineifilaceae bacterium]
MRILHLIQRYYPARGGAEKHLEQISNYLAAEGHEVTVVTTDSLDFELFWDLKRRRIARLTDTHHGVNILRFPVRHLPASQLSYPGLRRLLSFMSRAAFVPVEGMMRVARYTPWVPDLWRWIRETEQIYDLVAGMTIGFEPIMAAGQAYARRVKAPFVCYPLTHLGAGSVPGADPISRFYTMRHQISIVLDSDSVIAQTAAEQRFYKDRGLSKNKTTVIGPGVEPSEVIGGSGKRFLEKYGVKAPLILFVGYLSRDKGALATVEATRQLLQRGYAVELALIGTVSPTFRDHFDKLCQSDKERIHLLGPVEDSEKKDALAAASFLSMPSRTDSFGITYLEAWLYGIPVIAARSWGVTDVVDDGKDGLVVPFGDIAALTGAMQTLLDHPDEARIMGERGREKVYQNHQWEKKLKELGDIYQELAAEHSK